MGEYRTTLIACCCPCECEQFAAIEIAFSAAIATTYTNGDGGVSHWSVALSEDIILEMEYDSGATPACGFIIHDPTNAPDQCDYATGATSGCVIAGSVAVTYPDPDLEPVDPADDWPDKVVNLDIVLDYCDVTVDCEGNGTLLLAWELDGDAGELAEVLASTGVETELAPLIDGIYQISVTLVNWVGTETQTQTQSGTGYAGGGTVAATVLFHLVAP